MLFVWPRAAVLATVVHRVGVNAWKLLTQITFCHLDVDFINSTLGEFTCYSNTGFIYLFLNKEKKLYKSNFYYLQMVAIYSKYLSLSYFSYVHKVQWE